MYLAITYLNHKQDLKLKYLLGIVTTDPLLANYYYSLLRIRRPFSDPGPLEVVEGLKNPLS